ncbi:MAG: exosortase/archaeosortase family protein [Spirochaetes bacterium]|nr:exosortase/archaeosortase family protein [Spirochaetota bacterium]
MNQYLFNINNILIIPASLVLLCLYKKSTFLYLLSIGLLITSFTIKALIDVSNIDSINYDTLITNIIIIIILIYISFRILETKINWETLLYLKKIILTGFGIFFLVENIPFLRGIISYLITLPSMLLAKIFSFSGSIEGIDYGHYPMYWQTFIEYINRVPFEVHVPIAGTNIGIVLGCTGLREILLFYSIIQFTGIPQKEKNKTFRLVFFSIMIINIIRNAIVLIFTGGRNVPFETTHHLIGGIMIFLTLLGLFIYVLIRIPEVNKRLENLFGLKPIE